MAEFLTCEACSRSGCDHCDGRGANPRDYASEPLGGAGLIRRTGHGRRRNAWT